MNTLRLGFFSQFRGSDTLLFHGDGDGLRLLAQTMRGLSTPGALSVALHELPFVEIHHDVRVVAAQEKRDRGVWRQSENVFLWRRSPLGWLEAAEKVEVLVVASHGHQYIEEERRITVMVSRDEYGPEWWAEHGSKRSSTENDP
ncbi:MAG: hypothetical protein ACKVX7_16820 [Planctomycetota bacterium]